MHLCSTHYFIYSRHCLLALKSVLCFGSSDPRIAESLPDPVPVNKWYGTVLNHTILIYVPI